MSLSDDYMTFLRSSLGFDVRLGPAGRHVFPSKPLPKGTHLISFSSSSASLSLSASHPIHLSQSRSKRLNSTFANNKSTGTDILNENALVSVVAQSERRDRCAHCFNRVPKRLHCGACKQEVYCGVACQKKAWKLHVHECPVMCEFKRKGIEMSETTRLLLRFLVRRQVEMENGKCRVVGKEMQWFDELLSHSADYPREKVMEYGLHVTGIQEISLREGKFELNSEHPIDSICRFGCNGFTILDEEARQIGTGLYPIAALLNHSCSPNCVATFKGSKICLRTVNDVSSDEELCICYIDMLASTKKRRKELQQRYYFECQCRRCCSVEDPGFVSYRDGVSEEQALKVISRAEVEFERGGLLRKEGKVMEAKDVVFHACEMLSKVLGGENLEYVEKMHTLLHIAIDANDWDLALDVAEKITPVMERVYPRNDIILGLQYVTMAKLLHFLKPPGKDLRNALNHIQRGHAILSVAYGSSHRLVREISEKMRSMALEAHSFGL